MKYKHLNKSMRRKLTRMMDSGKLTIEQLERNMFEVRAAECMSRDGAFEEVRNGIWGTPKWLYDLSSEPVIIGDSLEGEMYKWMDWYKFWRKKK